MNRRTKILFLLFLLSAGAAHWFARISETDPRRTPAYEKLPNAEGPIATASPAEKKYLRIEDAANILAPFGETLHRMTEAFQTDLGIDLHVVTLTDDKTTIEVQATRVFEQRNIGKTAPTGGILVLVNPKLGNARIEVGYALEGALTDLHMSRIARGQLAPYASYGVAGMAVMDVVHYLRDHVYVASASGALQLPQELRQKPQYLEYQKFASGGAGARAAISNLDFDLDLKRTLSTDERRRYAPSADIHESIEALLRVKADSAGDPTLELFTPGSQMMRRAYPLAPFEELLRLDRIRASMPLEILQDGDYAVATSEKPATGFAPILLRREQGLWRVDLVETWKNLFFDNDGNYFLRNSNTPYAKNLTQFGEGSYYDIAQVPLGSDTIESALAALEDRKDVISALRRAEILYRNCFVPPKAFEAYEKARRIAPKDPLILETIGMRAMHLGFSEIAIDALEKIERGHEITVADAYSDRGDYAGAKRWIAAALKENPYDLYALEWQQYLAKREKRTEHAERVEEELSDLRADPRQVGRPVKLYFDPETPVHDPSTTIDVGGTEVFDHSTFGVWIKNTSKRTVEIESVTLTTEGDSAKSGLGDIKHYWRYPTGEHRLKPGESVWQSRVWGFTVETGHHHVRYVFHTCWHGVGENTRQCKTQWVDALP
jgi:TPM domain